MPLQITRSRIRVNSLEISFARYHVCPACLIRYRQYGTRTTTTTARKRSRTDIPDVAILGGGITGLVSAYYLSKRLPYTKITLFEASSRLGGWLNSRSVDVGNGKVVFEQGPRTLRPSVPNGLMTLGLVSDMYG